MAKDIFADLYDDLDAAPNALRPAGEFMAEYKKAPEQFWDACQRCDGTGMTRWGVCFACKGAKGKAYKTSPQDRAKAREQAAERKGKALAEWIEANRAVVTWVNANAERGNTFAQSLLESIARYGSLTERQIAAVEKGIARDAERAQAREAAKANAPACDVSRLEEAFALAKAARLKWPRLRLGAEGFTFSPAGANSKNPGAIYAKDGEQYLGKIQGGRFFAAYGCDQAVAARVVEVASDPTASAKAYGIATGTCGCCGRELTDPASIEAGIGPICAGKWGM